jgi:hypothetical protein
MIAQMALNNLKDLVEAPGIVNTWRMNDNPDARTIVEKT